MVQQKMFVCANFITDAEIPDDYTVIGDEDFVIQSAVDHLVEEHEWIDSPQLREDIKKSLADV